MSPDVLSPGIAAQPNPARLCHPSLTPTSTAVSCRLWAQHPPSQVPVKQIVCLSASFSSRALYDGRGGEKEQLSSLAVCRSVTIEYQRSQAKDLVAYFKSQAEEEAIQRSQYVHLSCNLYCQPCLLYTSPSPRDRQKSRMPSSA